MVEKFALYRAIVFQYEKNIQFGFLLQFSVVQLFKTNAIIS